MLSESDTDLAVFKIGTVVEVSGRTVRIRVEKSKNSSHLIYQGGVLKNVSVGGYVKIAKGFHDIVAKVDSEAVSEDLDTSSRYSSKRAHVDRVLSVSLLGYFTRSGEFRRGVRELPLINNDCFLLSQAEFDEIHTFVSENDDALTIGTLAMERGQPVRIGVDAVLASHIGIFGNTGSGKSYTLAKVYHELFQRYGSSERFRKRARFVLLDFNGEYVNRKSGGGTQGTSVIASADLKKEYRLSTRTAGGDRLPVDKATAEDPTFWTVLLDASEKTQAPFIQRTLESTYWDDKLADDDALKTEIAYIIHTAIKAGDSAQDRGAINHFLREIALALEDAAPAELKAFTDDLTARLGYHNKFKTFYYRNPDGTQIWANEPNDDDDFRALIFGQLEAMDLQFDLVKHMNRIRFKLVIQYYSDIFRGFANREHLGPVIKRLETRMPAIKKVFKVSDAPLLKKPLTVVSLRDVNLDMKKVIPLLLCRRLYDQKKEIGKPKHFLNVIIDEAHNILSTVSSRESEGWKDYRLETFEEIVKEGRKFGVFLTISSQRPHDISDTIVSQLHNYFLHRLVNNLDIHAVERAVSYLDKVSFDSLPILPTGTCIFSGVSAGVPVLIGVDRLVSEFEPNSQTMTLTDKWSSTS